MKKKMCQYKMNIDKNNDENKYENIDRIDKNFFK